MSSPIAINKNTIIEDQWINIQKKTFTNWINEQLSVSGRSVDDIGADFCDGVRLVSLVESLQFRKIGKVYSKPTRRIQMIANVSLAFKAIAEDNIKLVNIGNEDVVNGNLKLILGLVWHLVMRYQISNRKSKSPPKKLMVMWFQTAIPELEVGNCTTDWNDGIALHALLDYLKPGVCPDWRMLHSKNRVENCRQAMALAKEHFNIPRVISPEDFASSALDELSAMTYLSYFLKVDSPGYYSTLNWVCRQLRTTNITNLTTDWNDGYYICAVVSSLGGDIPGWPSLNRNERISNCQKGIDAAKLLGVQPLLTASEMADPGVDHLSMMTYLTKFQSITPKMIKAERLSIDGDFSTARVGNEITFTIKMVDAGVMKSNVRADVIGVDKNVNCDLTWNNTRAECRFTPHDTGEHKIEVYNDGELIVGCPISFLVRMDISKVKLLSCSTTCAVGTQQDIRVDISAVEGGEIVMQAMSPSGERRTLTSDVDNGIVTGMVCPSAIGVWSVSIYANGEEVDGSPVELDVYDTEKAEITGPKQSFTNELVKLKVNCVMAGSDDVIADVVFHGRSILSSLQMNCEEDHVHSLTFIPQSSGVYLVRVKLKGKLIPGSPREVEVLDPGDIIVTGDGIEKGIRGEEASFTVSGGHGGGVIGAEIQVNGQPVEVTRSNTGGTLQQFSYLPVRAGLYQIQITWNNKHIQGPPFSVRILDRSRVLLVDNLDDARDENDRLALECDRETRLRFDVSEAGPGKFTSEVLGPTGKLRVQVTKASDDEIHVAFTATNEGDHYIHMFWSEVPLDFSPIPAYCPGPDRPIDHTKVILEETGYQKGRATVPAQFIINGREAGPGVPKVQMQGVRSVVDVEVVPLKYNRYRCTYNSLYPGGFLLYVYWSGKQIPGSPFKVTISLKGFSEKVVVTGPGLKGGYVGQELRISVDTKEAGNGEVTAVCRGQLHNGRCDVIDQLDGTYVLKVFPTEAVTHTLSIHYDGNHVPGSPFKFFVGEPPDPKKVRVYGPGIEDGLLSNYESKFIVETYGAGSGQLAVKIRGPREAFRVEMKREEHNDRTIVCRYDPSEPGQYIVNIRWSGHHVTGSPFNVKIFETKEELMEYLMNEKGININKRSYEEQFQWYEDI
ncbi:hypothetical protein ScPMuIL_017762 [Solemya velum]